MRLLLSTGRTMVPWLRIELNQRAVVSDDVDAVRVLRAAMQLARAPEHSRLRDASMTVEEKLVKAREAMTNEGKEE
jgi:hypothetical protein